MVLRIRFLWYAASSTPFSYFEQIWDLIFDVMDMTVGSMVSEFGSFENSNGFLVFEMCVASQPPDPADVWSVQLWS